MSPDIHYGQGLSFVTRLREGSISDEEVDGMLHLLRRDRLEELAHFLGLCLAELVTAEEWQRVALRFYQGNR